MTTNQTDKNVMLYYRSGTAGHSVNSLIDILLHDNYIQPIYCWLEPKVTGESYEKFMGLCETPQTDIPLIEARLFGDQGMIHLLETEKNQCKFFECSESELASNPCLSENPSHQSAEFMRNEYPVFLRQDFDRFGFSTEAPYDKKLRTKVTMIEYLYSSNGSVFTWRIVPIKEPKKC